MGDDAGPPVNRLERLAFRLAFWFPSLDPRGYVARHEIPPQSRILDLGCADGSDSPLAIHPRREQEYSVGLDVFGPYLVRARAENRYLAVLRGDVTHLPFRDRSFDVVLALDVIEHLGRERGVRLMEEAERVASKKVVLLTPNGFLPQHAYQGDPWQAHRSGWTAIDFTTRGYRVLGMLGYRHWRGEFARCRVRPRVIGFALSYLSQLVTKRRPEKAFHLLAVKDLGRGDLAD